MKSSEESFFQSVQIGSGTFFNESILKVKDYVKDYRDKIIDFKDNDPTKLILDSFEDEIVIGNHLEAVLSRTPFKN